MNTYSVNMLFRSRNLLTERGHFIVVDLYAFSPPKVGLLVKQFFLFLIFFFYIAFVKLKVYTNTEHEKENVVLYIE